MSITKKLDQILTSDPKDQAIQFNHIIDEVVAGGNNLVSTLRVIGDKILSDDIQQQVRTAFVSSVLSIHAITGDKKCSASFC